MDPPTTTTSDTATTTTTSDTATTTSDPPSSAANPPEYTASEPESTATSPPLMPPPPPFSGEEQPPSNERHSHNSNSNNKVAVPYSIPEWSSPPSHPFELEVLKDGSVIENLDVSKKGAYMFGRIDLCDFVLEHPTISRFHAVLQFNGNGDAFLYDLGSTHGTFVNKNQVKKKVYLQLHVGDVIRFGLSTRLYIFQGPTELMPPEADLTSVSYAKDREASLRRAREAASLADGVSWGMMEDAIEEDEDDHDEITWQNYKGELTEKQQKTREKVLKRMEKIAHMKKEISAIRAKDIAQGGLTQGQQTQIARNEMRIAQIVEELESLEETLNDSIRESLGARSGKLSRGKLKGAAEDEDELLSDDDEFYDRTKKKSANKSAATQSVETADSLLEKKDTLMKEMEEKKQLILEEKNKVAESVAEQSAGDALDAFMSGLSSQLVIDRTVQLEKDISSLQTELDRIVYLLKIADPTGEAAKKRETTAKEHKSNESASSISVVKRPEKPKIEPKKVSLPEKPVSSAPTKQMVPARIEDASEEPKADMDIVDPTESKPAYHVVKPQWLGAVEDREKKDSQQDKQLDVDEGDEFVDYRDRKKVLDSSNSPPEMLESDLETAAPGLILRKKKQVDNSKSSKNEMSKASEPEPAAAGAMVEDAVALLLKHKRGLHASEEEAVLENSNGRKQNKSKQDNKRPKRVLGPEKPAFLETPTDYETWVPPKGQTGDGRTSLNDRLGY